MTVLITRPVTSGRLLANRLAALGYQTMLEPLLTIEPVTSEPPDVSTIGALLFTSANAVTMLPDTGRAMVQALPCFCVGDSTAAAARAAGFVQVHSAQGAGEDLARLIMEHYPAAQTCLLHICGMETDPAVQTALRAMGYRLASWAVYRAVPQTSFSTQLCDALAHQQIKAVLLFSPRTAQTFATIGAAYAAPLREMLAVTLSPAVAMALAPWPGRCVTADAPTEDALIACLMRHYPALSAHD